MVYIAWCVGLRACFVHRRVVYSSAHISTQTDTGPRVLLRVLAPVGNNDRRAIIFGDAARLCI